MNILKRVVKEALLIPYRPLQGVDAALGEVTDTEPKKKDS